MSKYSLFPVHSSSGLFEDNSGSKDCLFIMGAGSFIMTRAVEIQQVLAGMAQMSIVNARTPEISSCIDTGTCCHRAFRLKRREALLGKKQ